MKEGTPNNKKLKLSLKLNKISFNNFSTPKN